MLSVQQVVIQLKLSTLFAVQVDDVKVSQAIVRWGLVLLLASGMGLLVVRAMRELWAEMVGNKELIFSLYSPRLFLAPNDPRQKNALLIAASLIAAVRCSKEEKIEQSPRVICKVDDSVQLAKMVLKRIEREE